jgi:hypothetical protein
MKKVVAITTAVAAAVGVIAYKKSPKFKAYVDDKRNKIADFVADKAKKVQKVGGEGKEEESSDSSSKALMKTEETDKEE